MFNVIMTSDTLVKDKTTISIPVRDSSGNFSFISFTIDESALNGTKKNINGGNNRNTVKEKLAGRVTGHDHPTPFDTFYSKEEHNEDKHGKAQYYFDASDQYDVEKSAIAPTNPDSAEIYENAAIWLIRQIGIPLNVELQQRLVRIIISRWKEMRDNRQTKEALMRDVESGGLGLSETQADNILKTASEQRDVALEKGKQVLPGVLKQSLDKDKSLQEKPRKELTENTGFAKHHEKEPVNSLITEVKPRNTGLGKTETIKPKSTPSPIAETNLNVIGPVDELRIMTLNDFRRLGRNAKDSAQKIYQKIDLLEDESIQIKVAGIKAWKESEVYQDYLSIGQQSIEQGISVGDVIAKQKNGMTQEEFEAIADLSGKLTF